MIVGSSPLAKSLYILFVWGLLLTGLLYLVLSRHHQRCQRI